MLIATVNGRPIENCYNTGSDTLSILNNAIIRYVTIFEETSFFKYKVWYALNSFTKLEFIV